MRFQNPTPITIGMTGTFAGRSYRVAGRVVMGMEEAGETYHWNEFNLVGADGGSATLVHEVTEEGVQWRMFTLFEPQGRLSAQEAATKRVGETVNLDGKPMRVTLVDESRVYHIEGQAPEGVELGDVAHYFNAEDQNAMIVVSWTGDEVEFYRGLDLPRGAVAEAFGLRSESPAFAVRPNAAGPAAASAGWVGKIVGLFLAGTMFFAVHSCRSSRTRPAVTKPKLPAAPLSVGAEGKLDGATCRIRGHAIVEIAQIGLCFDRHEYDLVDDSGRHVLLVCGTKPGAKDWVLFTPFEPEKPLTPHEAAAKRTGDKVELDGAPALVSDLSRATILQVAGENPTNLTNRAVFYCFAAQAGTTPFLARWNAAGIHFHRGQILPAKDVIGALGQPGNRR